jgi:hypothetical protein
MRNPARRFGLTLTATARPTGWSALVLLVVATFGLAGCADQAPITPPSLQQAAAPSGPVATGPERAEQSERRVTQLPDGRVLEELHGEAASRHLRQLMSRRPEAFANVSLQDRGFRPSEEVVVQRLGRRTHAPIGWDGFADPGNPFFVFAQSDDYAEWSADGEIIFWSWDNGNPATWEGVIWFADYTTGVAGTNEAQVDISSTSTHELVFLENTYDAGGGGGGGGGLEPMEPMLMGNPARCATGGVRFASLGAGSTWVSPGYALAYGGWSWRRWGGCTVSWGVGGCAGAATGCALSGPGWAKCTGAFCAGAFVASAIGCAGDQMM